MTESIVCGCGKKQNQLSLIFSSLHKLSATLCQIKHILYYYRFFVFFSLQQNNKKKNLKLYPIRNALLLSAKM